jgi:purine-cytosine permease-like protein
MSKLLASRKFLLVCLDAVVGLAGLCAGFFLEDPDWQRFVLAFIGFLQPVFVAAILGVAIEDSAALKAGTHPNQEE